MRSLERSELSHTLGRRSHARDWWLAKVKNAGDASGEFNTLELVLVDGSFTESLSQQDATLTDRSASKQITAFNQSGGFIPIDSYVKVLYDGKRWWILDEIKAFVARTDANGIAGLSGSTPGSGVVTIYKLSSGSVVATSAQVKVYNLSYEVSGDAYIQIKKDGFGTWWIDFERCEEL